MEIFLLGGGAMCFRNQKNATKDLDLVFKNADDFKAFAEAINAIGFSEPKAIESIYKEMKPAGIWENKDNFRLDLFVKKVCGALELSEKMTARAELLANYGNLAVKIVSNEDVILFKGITERLDDTNDIAAIIRTSDVDWEIILQECIAQSQARAWYGSLCNKLVEINEKHGITAPIIRKLQKLDEKERLQDACKMRLKTGLTRKETAAELLQLGFKKKEIEDAMANDTPA
jgi:hypothetical protein